MLIRRIVLALLVNGNADQFLKITNGANVETGVMELGRSSSNSIEVLDGSLDGWID